MPEPRNLLADASSPYLLQHRDNPVHWRPWGQPALNEARETGKPILLSVGYAACHWCHVMAHESFENPEIADLMNELFVNIKVDREERPDIDQIYMAALQALGIQGGWPLTMFLTPEAEPVWGGTYFPPTPRFGRPSFPQVLRSVATLFREEGGRIEQNRSGLMGRLSEQPERGRAGFGREDLDRAAVKIATIFDQVRGGPRGAPKFPNASVLELLWRGADRTGSEDLRTPFLVTMERMCQGGIRDHVGGGFSRYAVDEHWLVPHFEKMLYDNAQLLELLVLAYSMTRRDLYRQAAIETVEWLLNEMVTDEGAFAASLDADQDGEEGRFYVWTPSEIARILDPDAALFVYRHFDVTETGNFEGHSIPNRLGRPDFDDAEAANWNGIRPLLVEARGRRTRPGRDDKILADWNGLAIAALARSARAFARPDWLAPARRAFHFVADSMTKDGRIAHSWRAGKLTSPGFASDHAAMMRAALALHESGEGETLDHAMRFAERLETFYRDDEIGGYFLTASDAWGLILRPRSALDEAIPNANGIAAEALLRLAGVTGEERYRSRADEILIGLTPQIGANIFGHAALLNALDIRLAGTEIGVKGSGPAADELYAAATALPFPTRIVRREGGAAEKASAILCIGQRCALPIEEPAALALTHRELRRSVSDA